MTTITEQTDKLLEGCEECVYLNFANLEDNTYCPTCKAKIQERLKCLREVLLLSNIFSAQAPNILEAFQEEVKASIKKLEVVR